RTSVVWRPNSWPIAERAAPEQNPPEGNRVAATMIHLLAAGTALAGQARAPAWTWSQYEGDGPVVLANDVPDTARLPATLECQPGDGVAQLALYGQAGEGGAATLRSGAASAATQAEVGRTGRLKAALRVDHPVF